MSPGGLRQASSLVLCASSLSSQRGLDESLAPHGTVQASASPGKFSERQIWSPAPELPNPNLHFNQVFRRFVCTGKFEECSDGLPDSGLVPKSVPSRFFLLSFITDCLINSQGLLERIGSPCALGDCGGGSDSQAHPLL